jgi:hypothetical protein
MSDAIGHSGAPGSEGISAAETAGPELGRPVVSNPYGSSQVAANMPTVQVLAGDTCSLSSDAPVPSSGGDPLTGLGLDAIASTGAGQGSVISVNRGRRIVTVSDWSQTAAALLRNRGLVVDPAPRERIDSPARQSAKRAFQDAWGEVLTAQMALRDAGWPGEFVSVGSSIPPELRPVYLAEQAARTRSGMVAPGRPDDPLIQEVARAERERFDAARRAGPPRRLTGRSDCMVCQREAGACDAHQGEGYDLLNSVQ